MSTRRRTAARLNSPPDQESTPKSARSTNGHETLLICRLDASDGHGSVPSAALAAYPAPTAGLYLVATNRTLTHAGGYTFGFFAESSQSWSSGSDRFTALVSFDP